MSFRERLQALKKEELRDEREVKAREEALKRQQEREERERIAETERLVRLVKEKFSPVFELVNEVYLEGKGKISVEGFEAFPRAALELNWDEWNQEGRGVTSWGGKQLKITLGRDLNVQLEGASGTSPRIDFSLNDKQWREQMEEGIHQILSTPRACSWNTQQRDWSR